MSRSAYAKSAVLILLALVLVFEGYLLYRYYDRYYAGEPAGANVPESTVSGPWDGETTVEETTEDRPKGLRVSHRATNRNIAGNSTYLDIPGATGDSGAVLVVEEARGPNGGAYEGHEIGVWYDPDRGNHWAIFNQDRRLMPQGSTFDVVMLERTNGLVHRANPINTEADTTFIDDPLTNGRPDAVLGVTQNWNPGYFGGVYNDHPVGVRYNQGAGKWEIYNRDGAALPNGAAFNVAVSEGSS